MIDLHMHSLYSDDGQFTPTELVKKCAASGIKVMAVTDHNTVRANSEAKTAAAEHEIHYIPGIEIDCVYSDTEFHVLGYGIDFESNDFLEIEQNIARQNAHASYTMLSKIQALGFAVTREDMEIVSKDCYWKDKWTGEMFAEVLLAKPEYLEHPLLKPYRPGGGRSDNPYVNFYWDFCSAGKPCYTKMEFPPMEQMIDVIHRNAGLAVLAHPGANLKNKEHLLPGIAALGIDGIEACSSYHTAETSSFYYKEALRLKKFVSCGSDYHGKTKPAVKIGGIQYPEGLTPEDVWNALRKHLSK